MTFPTVSLQTSGVFPGVIALQGRNVNSLFPQGLTLLRSEGSIESTRAGRALVLDRPVCSTYSHPQERVLFHPSRDANPFFHLFEALWMLAGRRDARWLDQFVGDFSERFAEPDGTLHGAYGFRWRKHWDMEGGGWNTDQLESIVALLRSDPSSRRAVLSMWDPVADLGADKRDLPCNTHCYFRVRQEWGKTLGETMTAGEHKPLGEAPRPSLVLDLTICCRSNDAIWGAYGANAVHFSILQEYIASRCGLSIGRMYQISNNFHAYCDILDKIDPTPPPDPYAEGLVEPAPIATTPSWFDTDLERFMGDDYKLLSYRNQFFYSASALRDAHRLWKCKNHVETYTTLTRAPPSDWRLAAYRWFSRRQRPVEELPHAS